MSLARGGWLILLTVLASMVLAVAHLPETWPQWLGWLRPAWVAMVVFYWVMVLPHRVGLVAMWLLGALVDVLQAEPLGLNGLILASITYVTWRFYERFQMYSLAQQGAVVFLLVLAAETFRMLVLGLLDDRPWSWAAAGPAGATLLLWPFVAMVLGALRMRFRVV